MQLRVNLSRHLDRSLCKHLQWSVCKFAYFFFHFLVLFRRQKETLLFCHYCMWSLLFIYIFLARIRLACSPCALHGVRVEWASTATAMAMANVLSNVNVYTKHTHITIIFFVFSFLCFRNISRIISDYFILHDIFVIAFVVVIAFYVYLPGLYVRQCVSLAYSGRQLNERNDIYIFTISHNPLKNPAFLIICFACFSCTRLSLSVDSFLFLFPSYYSKHHPLVHSLIRTHTHTRSVFCDSLFPCFCKKKIMCHSVYRKLEKSVWPIKNTIKTKQS